MHTTATAFRYLRPVCGWPLFSLAIVMAGIAVAAFAHTRHAPPEPTMPAPTIVPNASTLPSPGPEAAFDELSVRDMEPLPAVLTTDELLRQWEEQVHPHFGRANEEAEAIFGHARTEIAALMEEKKAGATAFAEAVLGAEGKLRYAASATESALTEIAYSIEEFFTGKRNYQIGPEPFDIYVMDCFRRHVVDPDDLSREVEAILRDCFARIEVLESELLIALQADLPTLGPDGSEAPILRPETFNYSASQRSVAWQVVEDARADFVIGLGSFVLSWFAGDMAQDALTAPDANWMGKLGVQAAAGYAADSAIKQGLSSAGYDPKSRMVSAIGRALDGMGQLIVEGDADEECIAMHGGLMKLSAFYPDEAGRVAATEAAKIIEHRVHLGLDRQLRSTWERHRNLVCLHVARAFFGPGYGELCFSPKLVDDYSISDVLNFPISASNLYPDPEEEPSWDTQDWQFGFQ